MSGMAQALKAYSATFQGTEAVDSGLSRITIGGQTFRYVPRLSNAWSSPPSVGTTLLVASINGSLLIFGAQVGDTSKAVGP
jgi:hypothetical protein